MTSNKNDYNDIIDFYKSEEVQSLLDQFLNQVEHFFKTNPILIKKKIIQIQKQKVR